MGRHGTGDEEGTDAWKVVDKSVSALARAFGHLLDKGVRADDQGGSEGVPFPDGIHILIGPPGGLDVADIHQAIGAVGT